MGRLNTAACGESGHRGRGAATPRKKSTRKGGRFMACAASVLLGCVSVAACAQTETITWKEEVALHDGKSIVVTRSMTLGGRRHEIGQGAPESKYTLSFTGPDG